MPNSQDRRWLPVVDSAGAFGAIAAALCCAGTPIIVWALAATGLSIVRRDAILWPVMLISLAVALWGFALGWRAHRRAAPLAIGAAGAISLSAGVIFVHGPPAMQMIYGGAILLIVATGWNVVARRTARAAGQRTLA
ncbi:MAG TPA: MerC domain-containing protein [Gemmatimonadaceae bacterium]